ncbi:MAG: DUF1998 domain-containing protein [Balneolia bacterium]|nr:DUF1998 domain-containing protein [Balneolia bacterium]
MARNEVGKIRQSNVIMNYGPGAVVDFRVPGSGASVSMVTAGIEQWEKRLKEVGGSPQDLKRMNEPRLAEKLQVSHFRQPPIAPDSKEGETADEGIVPVVGVRFPGWLQCPQCSELKPAKKWAGAVGDPARHCPACSEKRQDNHKVYAVPVRFVTACPNGHLNDFPWNFWIHGLNGTCRNSKKFKLKSEGPGLSGLVLSCPKCKQSRSMDGAFSPEAFEGLRCTGNRPWLAEPREADCKQKMKTMQRGASNLYFPVMDSALVIPPWSEEVIQRLGYRWNEIKTIQTPEQRAQYVDMFWGQLEEDAGGVSKEDFIQLVESKIAEAEKASSGNLRWDEYRQFMVAAAAHTNKGTEFEVRSVTVPETLPHIELMQRVVSLREIRALKGFTRIEPAPGSKFPVRTQYLSAKNLGWLPAVDNRGEGIFIILSTERLRHWESMPQVQARAEQITKYHESRVMNPDNDNMFTPSTGLSARFLLIHSLAHVLMKQLSLQCGYSSASLRERLYLGEGDKPMAGLMIFTATSDSDGTLGGLQRQGEAARFAPMFHEAIRASEWCSSDPLCINGLASATEGTSLATCHSCLLVPETCCEDFNRFLDRAMLVGTPEDRSIGFFHDLLTPEHG